MCLLSIPGWVSYKHLETNTSTTELTVYHLQAYPTCSPCYSKSTDIVPLDLIPKDRGLYSQRCQLSARAWFLRLSSLPSSPTVAALARVLSFLCLKIKTHDSGCALRTLGYRYPEESQSIPDGPWGHRINIEHFPGMSVFPENCGVGQRRD